MTELAVGIAPSNEVNWESEACLKGSQDMLAILSKCDDPRTYMAVCQRLRSRTDEDERDVSDSSSGHDEREGRTGPFMGTISRYFREAKGRIWKALDEENAPNRYRYSMAHPARRYLGLTGIAIGMGILAATFNASPIVIGASSLITAALGIRR